MAPGLSSSGSPAAVSRAGATILILVKSGCVLVCRVLWARHAACVYVGRFHVLISPPAMDATPSREMRF